MKKLTILIICLIAAFGQVQAQRLEVNPELTRKLTAAEIFIHHFYVDSLSDDKLVDAAIAGMLKELDPHSTYIKAKDVERSVENLNGSFEGIGVQFNMVEDTLVVIQPVSGGPSEKKGIIAGDRIVSVNDTAIAGVKMSRNEIMRRLRGPKGSKVNLGIVRQGVKGVNKFTIVRDKIPVHTLDASYMIDAKTGYIRLSSFGQTTLPEFSTALAKLREQGLQDLVLDLQGNGGGYLSAAVEIANEFLAEGDLIVYTDGRATRRQEYRSDGSGSFQQGRLVILVDSYTASAAEIVSGAVQDHDRGIIVGRRTFGKGLVQRPIDLPDKSVIRLTTSHYYTPSGRCIQKPYKMGERKDYDDDINARLKSGELTADFNPILQGKTEGIDGKTDSLFHQLCPDTLRYTTSRQRRTVFGGGGVMPDIYVTLDTLQYTQFHRQLAAKSCILNTSLKYLDKHRKELNKRYKDFTSFREQFEVPQAMIDLLLSEAQKAKVEYTDEKLQETLPALRHQLKALLARDLWDMSEYYQIINSTNEIYTRGLDVLNN